MNRLTKAQLRHLRAIRDTGYPPPGNRLSATQQVLNRLYLNKLIERATLGTPHPTEPYASHRLTVAGRVRLEQHDGAL